MEEELIVPGEFIAEKDVPEGGDVVLTGPPPAPSRITGPRPTGADPGMSYRGSVRANSPEGAASEAADISVARSAPAPGLDDSERARLEQSINQTDSPLQAAVARKALARKEQRGTLAPSRRDQALDAIIEQAIYDNSPSFQSASGTLASLGGAVSSLSNLGGLSGVLVSKFPALASRPVATSALDAALTNTLTDPLVQGIRTLSGGQEEYNLLQTALAPVIGGAFGGAMGGAGQVISRGIERADFNRSIDPRLTPEERAADMRIAADFMSPENARIGEAPAGAPANPESSPVDPRPPRPMAGPVDATMPPRPYSTADVDVTARANEPQLRAGTEQPAPDAPAPRETAAPIDEPPKLIEAGSSLDRTASWVIRDKDSKTVVMETFDEAKVRALNTSKYEAVPIQEYLGEINGAGGDRNGTPGTAAQEEVVQTFTTARGSEYQVFADGTTVRNKAARSDAGHEGDSGLKPRTDRTVYVDADKASRVSAAGLSNIGERGARLAIKDGKATLLTWNEKAGKWGSSPSSRNIPIYDSPAPGRAPLELWGVKDDVPGFDAYARQHAGNAISELASALPETLARRRGGQTPAQQPLGNQIEAGRPKVDQGTTPIADAAITRLEDIAAKLIDGFDALARIGKVKGGAQGTYNLKSGVVRARTPSDLDTLTHEIGHSFHLQSEAKADLDAIVKSNSKELQQFGAGQGAEGNAEAFANLFHAYVTNQPFAQMNYPNATAALDSLMRARFPDQMKVIEDVRQALDVIYRSPSVDVVRADQITTQPPKFGDRFKELVAGDKDPQGRVVYSAMDSLYTQAVDSNHPVYRAVTNLANVAKANGKPVDIKPVDDAYLLARRLPGSHGRADAMLKYGVIPAGKVSPEGPSLSSGIEKALGKKWDARQFENFGAYLTARRMVSEYDRFFAGQLERAPGKLSYADYQKAVADFETANPAFKAGADDIYAFQRNYLKRQFDKGLVTREFYEESLKRKDYVPAMRDLRNFEDGEASAPVTSMGGNGLLSRTIMKRFRGSDRPVINPLESIFKKVHDIEFAIARNDTINALARLSDEAGPGSGFIYEDIPSNQLKGQRVDVLEALKSAGKTAGLDEADLSQMMLQVEDVLGDSTWAAIFRQEPIKEGAEPIIYRWVNGERRAGRLGDDRFARELHHALTSMSDYEKDFLTTVLAMASGILRTGITKSPDFILTNAIRDQSTAMLTAGRRYIPFASMAKGLVEALQKSDDAIAFAGQGGLAGGAIVEAIESSNFGRNVKSLQGANWFSNVLKAFELSETGTRVGLYKSYIEQAKAMGFDDENAALYAAFKADDYIDFRKHGAAMGVPRRIYTFMNAAIQGSDKEIRAAASWPVLEAKRGRGETLSTMELDQLKDARVGVLRLATMGVVLGAGLAFYNSDNENVQNASKYWRANNFLFSVNGTDFAIPKGFGVVQSVINAFERGAEYAMRPDPTIAAEWLEGMAKAFMLPASNPAMTLAYDLPANYDRFRDRNIVPYYMQGWDATEQYSKYTSAFARQLSKAADMAGVKLSPMKIDYTIQQLGGGMARDALFGWDVLMGTDRPEKQVYDYPVLRRFVKNLERGSQASENFNKLVGEKTGSYEQAENAFKGKINNGERAAAGEYLRNLKEDERAWVTLNALGFTSKAKQMHPMMNARERVALSNGMVRQLVNGNVIKEEDLDRGNLTVSRRDAEPIALDPRQRALLQEEFLSYSVATARNAMLAVGAKGTAGLKQMDTTSMIERIRTISPAVADEFIARAESKNLPAFEDTVAAWPELKRRLLVDGENADPADLIPADVARRAKRRR